jgi:hypothetical protein
MIGNFVHDAFAEITKVIGVGTWAFFAKKGNDCEVGGSGKKGWLWDDVPMRATVPFWNGINFVEMGVLYSGFEENANPFKHVTEGSVLGFRVFRVGEWTFGEQVGGGEYGGLHDRNSGDGVA